MYYVQRVLVCDPGFTFSHLVGKKFPTTWPHYVSLHCGIATLQVHQHTDTAIDSSVIVPPFVISGSRVFKRCSSLLPVDTLYMSHVYSHSGLHAIFVVNKK